MSYLRQTIITIAALGVMLILMLSSGCKERSTAGQDILASLIGREIVMPECLEPRIQKAVINYNVMDSDFKIITYIDSSGCTSCQLRPNEWESLINNLKSKDNASVNFLMIISSNPGAAVDSIMTAYNFQQPVSYDSEGRFKTDNCLPDNEGYHTLLLDEANRVIAVGNLI